MHWTPEADAKLLVEVIKASDISLNKDFCTKVAEGMGGDCNAKTIQNRIGRLKASANGTGSATAAGSAPATPKKAVTPKKPRAKKTDTDATTPKRKRGKTSEPVVQPETDDDDESSPMKKVKAEHDEDEDDDDHKLNSMHMAASSIFA